MKHTPTRARTGGANDRGDIKILVAGLAPALILVIGLVVDGSGLLQARNQARWAAEQAARDAAQAVNVGDYRNTSGSNISIGAERAARIAMKDLDAAGYAGAVSVSGPGELLVEATGTFDPLFWPADIEVTGSATVHLAYEPE